MVELAHLTGERQNDLKDERRRSQIAAARQVLERSTMLLLTSSKVSVVAHLMTTKKHLCFIGHILYLNTKQVKKTTITV